MLYLNSIENAEDSPTEKKYAICHEEIPSMLHIPELAPSKGLLTRWQSQEISWEEFRKLFFEEMRTEYSNGAMSRLKGLQKYCLENDVTLHSPEPSGEQTYRAILEGIINAIWKSEGRTDRVINLARAPIEESQLVEGNSQQTSTIAQEEIANLVLQKILPEVTSAKDDEIRLIKENEELKSQIQLLQAENDRKNKENSELRRQIDQLEEQSQLLKDENRNNDCENDRLRRQIAQLRDINTHPGIRGIAVKATGDPPVFGANFETVDIDRNLPVGLRKWLEELLLPVVDPLRNTGFGNLDLNQAINQYHSFDTADNLLAHVIRTQGNLSAHENIDERTEMGRALCCFFAASLLSSKLSNHTSAASAQSIQSALDDAKVPYNRGIAFRKAGDSDRAIAEYTKAIELKPDYINAYKNRGNVYSDKGDYDRAIADYTKAIELKSDFTNAYYNRGTAYYRNNSYSRAIADLTRAIELKPDYANAYKNRGEVYRATGDRARAQADLYKAKQLQK